MILLQYVNKSAIILFSPDSKTVTEKLPTISPLVDQFSRTISYLRLSLTDRCNLRCIYCMPQDLDEHLIPIKSGIFIPHDELLSYEELLRVVRLTAAMGMKKIRLTGGEPLVRRGVIEFIRKLMAVEGLDFEYIARWSDALGVTAQLAAAQAKAGQ